nr:methyltransferase [Bradyrhizobium sp. CCGE-LA001]
MFDQPHVVGNALEVLHQHGIADRCEIVGGNSIETISEGADPYVLRPIIHDWTMRKRFHPKDLPPRYH